MKTNAKARNRRSAALDDDDDDGAALVESTGGADAADLDEELRALDAELGEDATAAKVVVHKIVTNGDSQRCFSCPRLQFFADDIPAKWGAGTYSVMVYANGRLVKRARLSFAEPITPPAPAAAPASTPASDVVTALERRLDQETARNFELLKILAGNRPAAADPLQVQQQTLTLLATVKELTAPASSASGGSDRSAIDVFLEGVKMAQRLGGGGSGEGSTDWGGVVLGVADSLKTLAASSPPMPASPRILPARPAPTSSPTIAAAAASGDPNSNNTTEGSDDMLEKLRAGLQFLARRAAAKSDPTLYADVAVDSLGELPSFLQTIALDYIQRADCIERLAQIEPAVLAHRDWFAQCLEEIRRVLSTQTGPTELTGDTADSDSGAQ